MTQGNGTDLHEELELLRRIAVLMHMYSKDKMSMYRLEAIKHAKEWHDKYQRGAGKKTNRK